MVLAVFKNYLDLVIAYPACIAECLSPNTYFAGNMKYYIIAGEASGDLHGSNLIRELKKLDGSAAIRCWGGDLMEQAGGHLAMHYRDLAFMGFAEVVMNLRTILRNLKFCKEDILQFKPD
ncbi:MAG TPA: hypothetical protein VK588_08800, partial [Chitinophagaceae bacterium]|nr:hypothetical protein [Chitinophagaceae bacterium]